MNASLAFLCSTPANVILNECSTFFLRFGMASPTKSMQYGVHICTPNKHKHYSVLAYSDSAPLSAEEFPSTDFSVHMSRENSEQHAADAQLKQNYGAGSEYGSAARQEARMMKYGHQLQKYTIDAQPWRLSIADQSGKERKFRGIRSGGIGEHADYWAMFSQDGHIEAVKVNEWYRLLPLVTSPLLDEYDLERRRREMDKAALSAILHQETEEGSGSERELNSERGIPGGENMEHAEFVPHGSGKNPKERKRKSRIMEKRVLDNLDHEVAGYESDDGDKDGREYDYISDSISDTEEDFNNMEQKVDDAMVAVADEKGLREIIEGGLSESETSDEEIDQNMKRLLKYPVNGDREKSQQHLDSESEDSSESDWEDPDEGITSAIFLPSKRRDRNQTTVKGGVKRRFEKELAGCSKLEKSRDQKRMRCDPHGDNVSTSGSRSHC
ncbi:General transcription factor IIF subunit 1 [Toxocara canis]|uniref:Transcription initiation factor IIF subunit alpha n=1 Tax=Toxocara canis TaxID=6265 RepID=A0A0B2V0H1_TOXCA|nr:General transcription factor IIF subunit 1 [Toxocara canis]